MGCGGLGQRVVLRNLGRNPMNIYLASERVRHPCFGVVEGQSGSVGKVMKEGKSPFPKGKVVLRTGERLEVQTPGGWGRAAERSRAPYRHRRSTPIRSTIICVNMADVACSSFEVVLQTIESVTS